MDSIVVVTSVGLRVGYISILSHGQLHFSETCSCKSENLCMMGRSES
jgi:hypothetical protein